MNQRILMLLAMLMASAPAFAQAPVTAATAAESLFTDPDPKLHANKQVVLHIVRDLLECNHWDEADKWLTPGYIQHNPLVVSGRDALVKFFGTRPRKPIPAKMETKIVSVTAAGDLVVVAFPLELQDPQDSSNHDNVVRHVADPERQGRGALGPAAEVIGTDRAAVGPIAGQKVDEPSGRRRPVRTDIR